MVRVRRIGTRELLTAAMCPGCWNNPQRRRALLRIMASKGVEPADRNDRADGMYLKGQKHAPRCPRRNEKPGKVPG